MSVIFQCPEGAIVCHEQYLERIYALVHQGDERVRLSPHGHLFLVQTPYMRDAEARRKVRDGCNDSDARRRKRKRSVDSAPGSLVCAVKEVYGNLLQEARNLGYFSFIPSSSDILRNNEDARKLSEMLYKQSSDWFLRPFNGENNSDEAVTKLIGSECFIFPKRSRFYCRDVFEIKDSLDDLGKFDMILLDPPWWNKYIRRKKAKSQQEGYKMMYNSNLGELPLDDLLAPGGIIAVWCTNASSNLEELMEQLFPKWGVQHIAQWYWLKVTKSGEPVCKFSEPPGKQPFEQLVFGVRKGEMDVRSRPRDGRVFMSVPSAVHSHKPPISEIMEQYLPPKPRCLEIFARYLLPNWTSWGLEVIKLQHVSLFQETKINID